VEKDEIKLKIRAVAVNPADHAIIDTGMFVSSWPVVMGFDCSGEIVEVGNKVQSFKVGDRVACAMPGVFGSLGNKSGAFQEYAVDKADRAYKLPASWSFSDACIFPLGMATAAIGLFAKDRLALAYPQTVQPPANGKVVLVWGGSSSVGACAVQLAAHAGYEVIATASKKNFELVKSFGASQVFDYKEADVVDQIAGALRGREGDYVGAYSATQEGRGIPQAAYVPFKLGLKNSMVATSNPRVPEEGRPEGVAILANIATQCFTAAGPAFPAHPEVGSMLLTWLTAAMDAGTLKLSPPPRLVGHGLEAIDEAVEKARRGEVSGEKLVVTL
jgi:threonine dehydrogenase-like Zn-dependent dehydrogenase